MAKRLSVIVYFIAFLLFGFQTDNKEKAIRNFEKYFSDFVKAYPADQNKYSFKNYSDLGIVYDYPEEIKLMLEYDTSKFYMLYAYEIKYVSDTLVEVDELNFSQNVKDVYHQFNRSVIEGEKNGKYNIDEDKKYSDELKGLLTGQPKPQAGYSQTLDIVAETPDGKVSTSGFYVFYNNQLAVVNCGKIVKE